MELYKGRNVTLEYGFSILRVCGRDPKMKAFVYHCITSVIMLAAIISMINPILEMRAAEGNIELLVENLIWAALLVEVYNLSLNLLNFSRKIQVHCNSTSI